jgi:hypothetical protein
MTENEDAEMTEKRSSALKGSRVQREPLRGSPISAPVNKQARIDEVQAWVGKPGGGSAGGKVGDGVAGGSAERVSAELVAEDPGEDGGAFVGSVGATGSQGLGLPVLDADTVTQVLPEQISLLPGQGPPGFEVGSYGPNWGKGGGQGFFPWLSSKPRLDAIRPGSRLP